MKKGKKIAIGLFSIAMILMIGSSIWLLADLRTTEIKNNTQIEAQILLAKRILNKVIKKQGMDKINNYQTYEMIASDNWKGMMGKMGNPWGWNKDDMSLRYSVGNFDGRVEVLAGEKKGYMAGIQSWDYYQKIGGQYQTKMDDNEGEVFIIAAFQYFIELANRLSKAPFIRYAGQDKLRGKNVDKVFVSWGNEPTEDYDQYVLWIEKDSGLIGAVEFTTRDNPTPAPAFMHGCLQFEDFRNIGGILIPFKQSAQLGSPKESTDDFVHQLNIRKFTWDAFPVSELLPFADLKPYGDDKPVN